MQQPDDPDINWQPQGVKTVTPEDRMALEAWLYGLKKEDLITVCCEHADTCVKLNLDGDIKKGGHSYKRMKCHHTDLDDEDLTVRVHSLTLQSTWQQLPAECRIPKDLEHAWFEMVKANKPSPAHELTARPVTRAIYSEHLSSRARYLASRPAELKVSEANREAKIADRRAREAHKEACRVANDHFSSVEAISSARAHANECAEVARRAAIKAAQMNGRIAGTTSIDDEDAFLTASPQRLEAFQAAVTTAKKLKACRLADTNAIPARPVQLFKPPVIKARSPLANEIRFERSNQNPPRVISSDEEELVTLPQRDPFGNGEQWMSPRRPSPMKRVESSPRGMETANAFTNLFDTQEDLINAIVDRVENRLADSGLSRCILSLAKDIASLNEFRHEIRQERLERQKATAANAPTNVATYASSVAASERTSQPTRPQGVRVVMSHAAADLVFRGIDPNKRRLHEIYVTGIRRTRKSLLRLALRTKGVDTNNIVDIMFVGKSVTMFLLPVEFAETMKGSLLKVPGIHTIDSFDPLDINHMKSLPQYAGKSDAELQLLARSQAINRIRKHIEKLSTTRVGTKKYYEIKMKGLETPTSPVQGRNRPSPILMSDFLLNETAPTSMASIPSDDEMADASEGSEGSTTSSY
jgi:hypothetical protein